MSLTIWDSIKLQAILLLIIASSVTAQTIEDKDSSWSLDLAFQQYFLPEESDLSVPVISFIWNDWLFESRYNYERRDAASFWLGRPFSFGEEWQFEITPMIGGIFAEMQGMAPGIKADINWRGFNLYSEMEYAFDFETREENFFYSWSELTFGVLEWLRVGIVGNRTRAYDSSVELDRGPIVSFEFG